MSTLDEIPRPLTKLIRLIMRGFYNIEQKLVIDMLVRRRETKEDDLVDVLKFERKHLRSLIQQMRQDKFINVRLIMETDGDGKSTRRNYYSINYRMFVNVVKYKIDHMRRKLETEERDLTSRASFICQSCSKTFTDLEVGQIFDSSRGQFRCSYCDGLVDEDPNVRPKADSRLVMASFNQQMEPIYMLLQETENIKWSINEADRNNMTATDSATANSKANHNNNNSNNPNNNNQTSNGANNSNANNTNGGNNPDGSANPAADNPEDHYLIKIEGLEAGKTTTTSARNQSAKAVFISPEVEALLLHEETTPPTAAPLGSSSNSDHQSHSHNHTNHNNHLHQHHLHSNHNSSSNHHNHNHGSQSLSQTSADSFRDEEEQEGVQEVSTLTVRVGRGRVPIDEISDEHVELMTPDQRQEYENLIKQAYSILCDY